MSGELSVLNCTAGDIRISFDKANEVEVARAKRMIEDMLRRGYILVIEVDGRHVPVKQFDSETCEYIVPEGALYSGDGPPPATEDVAETPESTVKKRGPKRRVPMQSAKATGIPPMGGG